MQLQSRGLTGRRFNMANNTRPPPNYAETIMGGQQQRTYIQPYQLPQPTAVRPPPPTNWLPKEVQPNDYLILTVVIAIICGILNLASLVCSVPAVICAGQAFEKKYMGEFRQAKKFGNCAAVLIILSLLWVMVCGMVIVGMLAQLWYGY